MHCIRRRCGSRVANSVRSACCKSEREGWEEEEAVRLGCAGLRKEGRESGVKLGWGEERRWPGLRKNKENGSEKSEK